MIRRSLVNTIFKLIIMGYQTFKDDNEGKSAASYCHHVAAWIPDILCNFYFVKNHKFANKKSTTTNAREKISTDLESLEF
jgi:hypothetical protein